MNRLTSFAVFGVAVLALSPLNAQMRGGRGPAVSSPRVSSGPRFSSGFRGGPMVAPRGPVAGPRVVPGSFARPSRFARGPVVVVPNHHIGSFGRGGGVFFHTGFHNGFHHRNRVAFFSPFGCFGINCSGLFLGGGFFLGGGPFFGGYPGYYPLFPEDYYSSQQAQQVQPAANYDNESAAVTAEIQRLSDEVQDLREQQQRQFEESRRPAAPPAVTNVLPPEPAVFIFKDGRKVSAKNYVVAGQTLWVLDERNARKYQIADLDRAATEQANAPNGIELRLPK
ncbi:MAG TPA: hypothetical protein VHN74_22030 [Candidatus Angelobacter sp.]|nr:hypothetical protein [Candidatus Angelobacter sp.]